QADWRDDTDDELEDQELEAHYMYMAKIQEVSPDAVDSGPIFDVEPLQKVSNDGHYNVFSIESKHPEQSESIHNTCPIEQDEHNVIIDSLDMSYDREQIDQNDDDDDLANERELLASLIKKLKCEIDDRTNCNKFLETSNKVLVEKLKVEIEDFKNKNISLESSNNHLKVANNKLSEINKLLYNDFKKSQEELQRRNDVEYVSKVEIDCAKAKGDLISYKMESQKSFNKYNQIINDLNQTILEMKKKLSAHQEIISILSQQKEAQIKLYKTREDKELDKVIALENKVKVLDNIVYKTGQLVQTMNMLNNKCRMSFVKPEFLKKAQRVNPRMYDIGCYNDNLALILASESDEKTEFLNEIDRLLREYYYAYQMNVILGVIPTTSVSRPQLKSNPMKDRVMLNNSKGNKHEVEDQRRNVKLSKNKTSITACNDSLNAKTLNVNFVYATCGKCVLNDKHDMCVLKSVDKPLKKTVASESNQKPRNITRKLYERVSKACSWWYPKFTPLGYKWKPKSEKENVNPNLVEIVLFIVDFRCSKHMIGNLKLLFNFVETFLGTVKFGNDQITPILGYGDLVQGAVTIKKGNDLLTGSRGTDLYSIILQDTNSPNPICLMAKTTSLQAWLWHRRLSHLNFDTINLLSKNDIVVGLPKLKFIKDHICSSCELGKAKQKSFQSKVTPSLKRRLQLLHIDLCGPMRVASINGKRYVLVIIDDYSIYTWTYFLRSKDETPKFSLISLGLSKEDFMLK
nr:hypothetical protein [Tanacetum cinerariifolium]